VRSPGWCHPCSDSRFVCYIVHPRPGLPVLIRVSPPRDQSETGSAGHPACYRAVTARTRRIQSAAPAQVSNLHRWHPKRTRDWTGASVAGLGRGWAFRVHQFGNISNFIVAMSKNPLDVRDTRKGASSPSLTLPTDRESVNPPCLAPTEEPRPDSGEGEGDGEARPCR
jgi:hypothetical protein